MMATSVELPRVEVEPETLREKPLVGEVQHVQRKPRSLDGDLAPSVVQHMERNIGVLQGRVCVW